MSRLEDSFAAELALYSLPAPVREFKFHPKRKWPFDMAWVERKIAVEIHGGLYSNGGHNRGAYMETTFEKMNEAMNLGWRVYIFGPKWLRIPAHGSSKALAFMYDVLRGEGSEQ